MDEAANTGIADQTGAAEAMDDEARDAARLDAIIAALRTVHDPEIPINIYDLGLIYAIDAVGDSDIAIDMTLTAPGCPVAGILPRQVEQAVEGVEGVGRCTVNLVWEPAWTKDRMSEEALLELGMF